MRRARPPPHTRLQARAPRRISPSRMPPTGDLRRSCVWGRRGGRAPHVQDGRRKCVDGGGRVSDGARPRGGRPRAQRRRPDRHRPRWSARGRPPRIGDFRRAPSSWSPSRRTTSGARAASTSRAKEASSSRAQVASRGRRRDASRSVGPLRGTPPWDPLRGTPPWDPSQVRLPPRPRRLLLLAELHQLERSSGEARRALL